MESCPHEAHLVRLGGGFRAHSHGTRQEEAGCVVPPRVECIVRFCPNRAERVLSPPFRRVLGCLRRRVQEAGGRAGQSEAGDIEYVAYAQNRGWMSGLAAFVMGRRRRPGGKSQGRGRPLGFADHAGTQSPAWSHPRPRTLPCYHGSEKDE